MNPAKNWPLDNHLPHPFDQIIINRALKPIHPGKLAHMYFSRLIDTLKPLGHDKKRHLINLKGNIFLFGRITRDCSKWKNIACNKKSKQLKTLSLTEKKFREAYYCRVSTSAEQFRKLRQEFKKNTCNCTIIIPFFSKDHAMAIKYQYFADDDISQIIIYNPTAT